MAGAVNPFDQFDTEEKEGTNTFDQFDPETTTAPVGDGSVVKPSFTTNMWDGYNIDDARAIYENFRGAPNVEESLTGGLYYRDPDTQTRTKIPVPEAKYFGIPGLLGFDNPATVSSSQVMSQGAMEAVGDAAEFGASVVDKVAGTDMASSVREFTPRIDTSGSVTDALLADAVPAMVPGIGVSASVFKAMKYSPALIRGVTTAIVGETAASVGVGTDEGTLLFGDGAAFPAFNDIADLGDAEADKVIEHRLNTFTEGLLISGVVTGAAVTTKEVGKIAGNYLLNGYRYLAGGERAVERDAYLKLSKELANISPDATPAELAAARDRVATIIRENKEVLVQSLGETEASPVTVDTVSALLRGTDDPTSRAALMGQRRGAMNTPAGAGVQQNLDAPARRFQEGLQEQRQALSEGVDGGETGLMQQGAEGLVSGQRKTVAEADAVLRSAQEEYDNIVPTLFDDIANDVEFGEDLARLETVTGTRIPERQTARMDEIQSTLRNSYESMNLTKNELYSQIQGGDVDYDRLLDFVMEMKPAQLDAAYNAFPGGQTQVNRFFEIVRRSNAEAAAKAADGEIDASMVADEGRRIAVERLEALGLDYGTLYTEIRPVVSYVASNLYSSTNPADKAAGRVMRDFVHYIDGEALDHVEASDPALAQAAVAAKDFYSNEYAPIWRSQGKMEDYARLYDRTIGRTSSGDMVSRVTGDEFSRAGYNEQVEGLTKGIMQGGNRFEVQNLGQALQQTGNPDAVADYMILDVINSFANDVKASGLQGADLSGFSQRLQRYAESLRQSPFTDKADSIDGIIQRIDAAKGDQAQLEQILEGIKTRSADVMEEVRGNVVSRFFLNKELTPSLKEVINPEDFVTTSNPYAAFSRIFSGTEARANVDLLLAEIGKAPELERGVLEDSLKLAYNKFLDDTMFGRSTNTSGVRNVNATVIDKTLDELRPTLDIGRRIYGDDMIDAVEASLQAISDITQTTRATPIRSESATGYNQAAATATSRIIYAVIGPLSRTGTRIRSIMGGVVEAANPDETAAKIVQNLFADPDYFLKLADKYNRNPSDPLLEDLIIRYTTSGIIKSDVDRDQVTTPSTTDDLLEDFSRSLNPPDPQ